MKLNQVLAIEKGVKSASYNSLTALDKKAQKAALYDGRNRTYQPIDDEGEVYPPESQRVQLRSQEVLRQIQDTLSEYFDIVYTKDSSNLEAIAEVRVDGKVILERVPVTHLLFLEKQLTDLRTMVGRMPVLDPADTWAWDDSQSAFRTDPVKSAKTKKIPRNHVKAKATEHHPEQVEVYHEDVVVGYWTNIKYSGALSQVRKDQLMDRIEKLQRAVKMAREHANSIEVERKQTAASIFGFIFGEV